MITITKADVEYCKKDLLYLVKDIPDWRIKPHLHEILLTKLTNKTGAFRYDPEIAKLAYESLMVV